MMHGQKNIKSNKCLKCVPFSVDDVIINRCLNAIVPFAELVTLASLSCVTVSGDGSKVRLTSANYTLHATWSLAISSTHVVFNKASTFYKWWTEAQDK